MYSEKHVASDNVRIKKKSRVQQTEVRVGMTLCAAIADSDQPAHPRSLIRVFDGRSVGRQGPYISSGGKLRLRSDCVDENRLV